MEAFLNGVAAVAPVLALALFLATINERLVEFLVKPLLETEPAQRIGGVFWTPYIALLLGALIALAFGIDLLTPVAEAVGAEPVVPWAGAILSALLVGGGSTFIHDVWPGKGEQPTTFRWTQRGFRD